jgi:hypothetical protein
MSKKLRGRALARSEAGRDIWQEVLDGVRQIKAGRGKRLKVEPRSPILRVRLKAGPICEKVYPLRSPGGAPDSSPRRDCVQPFLGSNRLESSRQGGVGLTTVALRRAVLCLHTKLIWML